MCSLYILEQVLGPGKTTGTDLDMDGAATIAEEARQCLQPLPILPYLVYVSYLLWVKLSLNFDHRLEPVPYTKLQIRLCLL